MISQNVDFIASCHDYAAYCAQFRGCLHDTGTSFIVVRVHPGSYLSLCICLHDTGEKSHTSTTHTGMSSSR